MEAELLLGIFVTCHHYILYVPSHSCPQEVMKYAYRSLHVSSCNLPSLKWHFARNFFIQSIFML
jgi:hypothetical protein